MKVTVITPCYNPGEYLLPMLESVERNIACVEKHILMDGGSTDGTVDVLEKWGTTRAWFEFVSEKDKGQSDACQKAFLQVSTEYFYWLNADDIMLDGAVSFLLSGVAKDAKPSIVYGDYLKIDSGGRIIARRRQPSFSKWDCLHGYLTVQNAAAIFNTDRLRAAGGFDPSFRFAMDMDIIFKLIAGGGDVIHIRKISGAFRIHPTSKTSTMDDVCKLEAKMLRTRYGVSYNEFVRCLLKKIVQVRIFLRMLIQGCLWDRIKERFS